MAASSLISRQGRALALTVGAIFAFTACASSSSSGPSASAPGITASQITIGSTQPLTGPAAPGYSEISKGSNAYFQWVNDHGGVNSRTIKYQYEDDGYNPTNTSTIVRKQVLQDKVFAEFDGLGTPTQLAVVDYLNTEKVPDLFVASGCNCWNQASKYPYTYGWQPDYTIEGQILGQYVTQNYAGQPVGYFAQNDEFGQDGVVGLDKQIPSSAVGASGRQKYDTSNTNVGPQIAALQAGGAKVVVAYSIPAFTALAMLAAAKIGYHPQWVVSNVGADPTTLTGLVKNFSKGAAGASLLEGVVSDTYLAPLANADDAWIKLFTQIHDKYIKDLPMDGNVEYGMAVAYSFVELMKKSGQNPTRQSVLDTLNGGTLSQGAGLAPFGYSSSNHLGYLGVQIAVIKNGAAQVQGSVLTATDDSAPKTASGGEQNPPTNGLP
jgi:ABC-type branched-subunit amino acid transport system substrate-binding protein